MSGPNNYKIVTIKYLAVLIISSIGISACTTKPKQQRTELLINAANQALNKIKSRSDLDQFNSQLKTAAGVAIFPSVYKAGFFAGAEGGNGILISKKTDGNWGYPAFYTLASGSWGLQFGGQKSSVIFIIRNAGAVKALLQHQGKLSAGMNVAIGTLGTGLEGAITTNLSADILVYSDSQGLFTGVALKGSAFIRRNDLNAEYYGGQVVPKSIVVQHAHQNPQADTLRDTLNR
jgi:lipid-binding SYLF domain-containing protein